MSFFIDLRTANYDSVVEVGFKGNVHSTYRKKIKWKNKHKAHHIPGKRMPLRMQYGNIRVQIMINEVEVATPLWTAAGENSLKSLGDECASMPSTSAKAHLHEKRFYMRPKQRGSIVKGEFSIFINFLVATVDWFHYLSGRNLWVLDENCDWEYEVVYFKILTLDLQQSMR